MKTMELSTMAAAGYKAEAMTEKCKKAMKRYLASTVKFLLFISPVYPQCTQGMKP
jgi:hypothetical protein